ncbi:MAG: ABC transporter ATP-binding protein [Desulfobacteraceae bacterium]|nr:ABC transporter ATP-binding protein [Desulfobacteraceae bacterium]
MLEIKDIHSYYGSSYILQGVSLKIKRSEVVSLVGRNGAGKTTTLKSIMGIVRPAQGSVKFKGAEICGLKPYQIARLGLGYVPEDRRIYPNLTLKENLEVAQIKLGSSKTKWNFEKVYQFFPQLKALGEGRLGSNMSGGEQQMLTIARTLMGNPEFILLDEPSEGLAPLVVSALADAVNEIKVEGVSILLSEQNMKFATKTTTKSYVIDGGKISFEGTIEDLMKNEELVKEHITL